jgi:hypothetical protein
VLGGNVMVDDPPEGAAFRLTMPNNRAVVANFASRARYISFIGNDECRMTKAEGNPNDKARTRPNAVDSLFVIRASILIRHSSLGFRHSIVTCLRQQASALAIALAVSPLLVSLARTVSQKPRQNRKHS